jgi:hypothetical protein
MLGGGDGKYHHADVVIIVIKLTMWIQLMLRHLIFYTNARYVTNAEL